MAETEDSSKTEEPTSKRLQESRERGDVVRSQDVQTWATLGAGALALAVLAPAAAERLVRVCVRFIEQPERLQVGFADAQSGVLDVVVDVGMLLAPILLLMAICGAGAVLAQTGLIWAPDKLKPDFGKISPIKGLHRLFSLRSVVEFIKSLIKLSVVAVVIGALVLPLVPGLDSWPGMELASTLARTNKVLVDIAGGVAATMTLVAIIDYGYQRFNFMKQARMTKQEVRDEHKQSDGDPHVKARIRQLRQERGRKRMMAAVPTATVVITNPTHYAVALAYDMQSMGAPKVVAKGVDSLARRIREIAKDNDVPIVENPPLARTLHAAVDVDDSIPPEHYQAVAQVIGYVMRMKGEQRPN
jgi:flagellar biosynthesis protein FlhB